ncbi:MAG: prepilin-type N-terminal cleavage/methylation domain-containing protein [Gammaproteobacteria bacterium]|nr:prepilin-type N-terminal cleavage/methylation domain-containing protein [Gammaproteobacteria bacterium]MBQ0838768.1 prepilin-type N-terminal cleavage/methylation domain-containing protein [Gammaproteobacteria bacterium]
MKHKNIKALSNSSRQSGFTLVEIAIVLVIIGLILGGVLKGQVLIENAKYKSFVKQIESYRAAVYTFQDTYRGLPGDLLNVSALDAAATAGDGDGLIEGGFCDISGEEVCKVWSHLRYAGIISGDPGDVDATASPTHTYGGLVSSIGTGNWANGKTQIKILTKGIPGDVAQRYDNEFDDGDASTGSIARYGGSGTTYNADSSHDVFIAL